ncbi:MAG: effector binding domain-containing protein [Thermoplasmatota archaeon]
MEHPSLERVETPAMLIVGIPVCATWKELWTQMPAAWRKFWSRRTEIRDPTGSVLDVSLLEQDGHYVQLVGAAVAALPDGVAVPEGMVAVSIPSHEAWQADHHGPLEAIADSFGAIYAGAQAAGHPAASFKLDAGYTEDGSETRHRLSIATGPVAWELVAGDAALVGLPAS